MQPSSGIPHFLDIPSLISLVLDSTEWTLLKTNVEKGQKAKGQVRQDSFLKRDFLMFFSP